MNWLLIAASVSFACQAIFVLAGVVTRQKMINQVNSRLPAEHRFASTGWPMGDPTVRLQTMYRRLYPDGPLVREYRWRVVLMLACFLSSIGCVLLHGYLGSPR